MPTGDHRALQAIAEQVVTAAGFDLEDLTVVLVGRRRLVKVVIDSDTGVDLDRAAEVSRKLSEGLDEAERSGADLGALPYVLEVTSPGIGRPLTLPRHFARARGRLLNIVTVSGENFSGRVRSLNATAVELLAGPAGLTPRSVALTDIAGARVEVEFSPAPAAVLVALGDAARVDPEPEFDDLENDWPADQNMDGHDVVNQHTDPAQRFHATADAMDATDAEQEQQEMVR